MAPPRTISDSKTLLSVSAAARELGVHRTTVHVWIQRGIVRTQRHGIHHAISRAELARVSGVLGLDWNRKEATR
jgi:excisionase family DNA binding protein